MTLFDAIEAFFVSAIVVVWLARGRHIHYLPAVGGFIMLHVAARQFMTIYADPLPVLAVMYGLAGVSGLFFYQLSNYGRVFCTAWLGASIACFGYMAFGLPAPAQDGGLAFDLWNAISAAHYVAGLAILAGIIRYDAIRPSWHRR